MSEKGLFEQLNDILPSRMYEVRVPPERYSGFRFGDKVTGHDVVRDPDEAIRLLNRVELKNPPFPISFDCHDEDGYIEVRVTSELKARDTGEFWRQVAFFSITLPAPAPFIVFSLEKALRSVFMHEFEECFHFEGRRVHEPHPGGSPMIHEYDRAGYRR